MCRVPRDAIPPTPPGPEGSNGNGLVRVQRGARCFVFGLLRDKPLEIPEQPEIPRLLLQQADGGWTAAAACIYTLLIDLLRLSNPGKTAYNIHFIFHLLLLWRK